MADLDRLTPELRQQADEIIRECSEQGMMMEAGFRLFLLYTDRVDASPEVMAKLRFAFMAGVEHCWSSTITQLKKNGDTFDVDERVLSVFSEADARFLFSVQDEVDGVTEQLHLAIERTARMIGQ